MSRVPRPPPSTLRAYNFVLFSHYFLNVALYKGIPDLFLKL
jgi:hypothetical protein